MHYGRRFHDARHALQITTPRGVNPNVVAAIQRTRNQLSVQGAQLVWTTVEHCLGRNPVFAQPGVDRVRQHLVRVQAPVDEAELWLQAYDYAAAALRMQVYAIGFAHALPMAWLQTEAWGAVHIPIRYGGMPLAWTVAQTVAGETSCRVGAGAHGLTLIGATGGAVGTLLQTLQASCPRCLPGQGGPAALMPRRASMLSHMPGDATLRLTDPMAGHHALWHVSTEGQLLPADVHTAVTETAG